MVLLGPNGLEKVVAVIASVCLWFHFLVLFELSFHFLFLSFLLADLLLENPFGAPYQTSD